MGSGTNFRIIFNAKVACLAARPTGGSRGELRSNFRDWQRLFYIHTLRSA
eukprot:m.411325 g.411325  ORF g.411325 m.411325 type:complete len:50 (+) comp16816_c0_seq14:147-296(+)